MKVGLTYDLRSEYLALGYGEEETAEFDREETIAALEGALRELGHEVLRIGHVRSLVEALVRGERWDAVFNICEGMGGFGREAQVPAILEAWRIPYTFADPLTACVTLHKGTAKRILRDSGVATTDFRIVERLADVDAVDLPFPLFVKPVAEGTAKGITALSRVLDRDALRRECGRLLLEYRQPVLVEPYLSGREFTTGIVGSGDQARAIATMEIVLRADTAEAHAYTYLNKEQSEERCDLPLADAEWSAKCAELALRAWRALGCRDAGRIDLRADGKGRLQVMEANPLPGMLPGHSDLPLLCDAVGVPYVDLVRWIIDAALARGAAG